MKRLKQTKSPVINNYKKIKLRAHYLAALELLELMSLASLIALIADAIWIVRDIAVNGATSGLCVICVMLWAALGIMGYGFYKYHSKAVRVIITEIMRSKLRSNEYKRNQGEVSC